MDVFFPMGSFLRVELPSDDEEDDDYDPTKDSTAEKEDRLLVAGGKGSARGGGKRKRGVVAVGQTVAEGGDDVDDADDSEDEDEDELSPKTLAKRARAADTFAKLNHSAAAKAAAAASGRPGGVGRSNGVGVAWASLPLRGAMPPAASRAVPKPAIALSDLKAVNLISLYKQEQPAKKADADKFWMQQLLGRRGVKPLPGSTAGAAAAAAVVVTGAGPEVKAGAALFAAQALEAAKTATSATAAAQAGKVVVMETRKFAGQEIQVKQALEAGSRQAQKAQEAAQPKSGLDAVLSSLAAAKKVTILDKSRQDWSGLKEADTSLEEELEAHKKGGDQYLDKQGFLQRADLREYEQERDRRLASDMRTRGRL